MPPITRSRTQQRATAVAKPLIIIYTRVSTKAQLSSNALAVQEDNCRSLLGEQKETEVKVIQEVSSAYSKTPPLLQRLLLSIPNDSIIVVHRYDRFSRNLITATTIIDALTAKDVRVVSTRELTDTLTLEGRAVFLDAISAAQRESDSKSQGSKDSIAYLRKQGNYIGSPPPGARVVKALDAEGKLLKRWVVEDRHYALLTSFIVRLRDGVSVEEANRLLFGLVVEEEQRVPIVFGEDGREIYEVERGGLAFREIADLLNEYGLGRVNGSRWSDASVRREYVRVVKERDSERRMPMGIPMSANKVMHSPSASDIKVSVPMGIPMSANKVIHSASAWISPELLL